MSDRHRLSRRTALRTLGLLGTGTVALPAGARDDRTAASLEGDPPSSTDRASAGGPADPVEPTPYIGVVDRIVDGRHVVVLLEDCETVVDQLVVPRRRFDSIAERDVLLAVVGNDDLLAYRHLPRKPDDCPGIGDG